MREYKGFGVDDEFNFYNMRTGNKVTPFVGTDGYYQVSRRDENQHAYHARVHVILAELFLDNPNGYHYVNHIDSNKLNNSLDNLEWCTNSRNVQHGWDSGNRTHRNRTAVQAIAPDGTKYTYPSIRQLAQELRVDRGRVASIIKGQLANHYDYEFSYV